ncbi:MAG: zf-HC2 domain-containing protein [Planctomycetota bacterium]|nr:MAG: zf-HC2 domain-containing protein [Planctomycetota bacterium]
MNSCSQFQAKQMEYLDKELPSQERQQLEEHLRHCLSCQQQLRGYQTLLQHLKTLPSLSAPPSLFSSIQSTLKTQLISAEAKTKSPEQIAQAPLAFPKSPKTPRLQPTASGWLFALSALAAGILLCALFQPFFLGLPRSSQDQQQTLATATPDTKTFNGSQALADFGRSYTPLAPEKKIQPPSSKFSKAHKNKNLASAPFKGFSKQREKKNTPSSPKPSSRRARYIEKRTKQSKKFRKSKKDSLLALLLSAQRKQSKKITQENESPLLERETLVKKKPRTQSTTPPSLSKAIARFGMKLRRGISPNRQNAPQSPPNYELFLLSSQLPSSQKQILAALPPNVQLLQIQWKNSSSTTIAPAGNSSGKPYAKKELASNALSLPPQTLAISYQIALSPNEAKIFLQKLRKLPSLRFFPGEYVRIFNKLSSHPRRRKIYLTLWLYRSPN